VNKQQELEVQCRLVVVAILWRIQG